MKRIATSPRMTRAAVVMCVVILACTACTSLRSRSPISNGAAPLGACFPAESFEEWEPIDDRSLLLWASGAERPHLVTLETPKANLLLTSDFEIVDIDLDGLVCAHLDSIQSTDHPEERARIASIEPLSAKRIAELLATWPAVL